ncbi:TPA: hypothetical protein PKT77_002239 [Acinetobacter baumannii]|uniref:hypothetical protein n=1 Tax=Acinetobacter baumannii TaxID=470 RepID=UPI00165FC6AB|nr:hypothetical protein [Acinetobacter baumannii]EKV3811973.1 hypothetical protein [Acinetobacter baumannii]EKW1221718.1 hypothetical protein [Acinetobacter baumannii]ELB0337782.1 hypothetical protein [Acinetobacter baumannii]ELN4151829.1 hypothetical protein [Acinetobacter baumannii]MBD0078127.1 hypothetical protein [Acinetobacter baumannii]
MTDLNKERELFEEAYLSIGGKQRELELEDGEYTNSKSLLGWELWQIKAKAQAVPEGFKIVPIELSEEIAERLALERVQKPRPENDPVWVEIAERAYKSNLLAKKWELVREYKILTEASESGAEG